MLHFVIPWVPMGLHKQPFPVTSDHASGSHLTLVTHTCWQVSSSHYKVWNETHRGGKKIEQVGRKKKKQKSPPWEFHRENTHSSRWIGDNRDEIITCIVSSHSEKETEPGSKDHQDLARGWKHRGNAWIIPTWLSGHFPSSIQAMTYSLLGKKKCLSDGRCIFV